MEKANLFAELPFTYSLPSQKAVSGSWRVLPPERFCRCRRSLNHGHQHQYAYPPPAPISAGHPLGSGGQIPDGQLQTLEVALIHFALVITGEVPEEVLKVSVRGCSSC